MSRGSEIARDVLVTLGAGVRTHKLCSRNARRRHDRAIALQRGAGEENDCDGKEKAKSPEDSFAAFF